MVGIAGPDAQRQTPSATAEAALAAADEAYARFDVDGLVAHLSAAVRGFTEAGLPCRAAMACARLGDAYATAMGNLTAGRAWFARAQRLVADQPACIEQGWVAVAAMGCDVGDPAELLAAAELALDRARRFGDVNLELKALADGGLAKVQAGDLAGGMAWLDEAMALACGPADDVDATSKSVCSFFTACYRAADFDRADSWATLLRRHGRIGPQPGGPIFLSSHCDSVQATMLCELGRWSEAEALLERAIAAFSALMPSPGFHPEVALADLRTRQGRYADAEALLLGRDHIVDALLPAARLHAARGDLDLAAAVARRGLRLIGDDRLLAVELLGLLAGVELARCDVDAAERIAGELALRIDGVDVPALRARADAVRSRVLEARGDLDGAIAAAQEAHDRVEAHPLPWLRATLLIQLARLRDAAGDAAGARVDARAAAALIEPLDVVLAPADVELLTRLTAATTPAAAASASVSTSAVATSTVSTSASLSRDGKWWDVTWQGRTARLPDTKGLRYLAELVGRPGVERHALDLVDRVEGVAVDGSSRRALGDAGELLDATARTAYRHRIAELRDEIDDLLAAGSLDRAEERQGEIDALVRELARAFGLGAKARAAGSAAERARLNVTRALRAATARLAEALPGAGEAIDRRLRTGLYSAYEPVEGDVVWIVQS